MIVRMKKYDFILFSGQKDDFLNKLQDLGLVDITVKGWEPNDDQRNLMLSVERHNAAVARLRAMSEDEAVKNARPYTTGEEAYNEYIKASTEEDRLTAEIAQARKEAEEIEVWGDFDVQAIRELEKKGVILRFFHSYSKEFKNNFGQWSSEYRVVPVNDVNGSAYFVVVAEPGQEVLINAQEVKAPTETYQDKIEQIEIMSRQREGLEEYIVRAAASVDLIEQHGREEQERLHFSQVVDSGQEAADGSLVIMEGWATAETALKVDAMLEEYPNILYLKEDPTPDDDVPVVLKNNRFNRMFEIIGSFYSLPKYGTLDLTPFFGPFYVLFFGLCLADAGYGLIFFIAGLVAMKKVKPSMQPIAGLVTLCGLSTVICGTFMGSFFGIDFTSFSPFVNFQKYVLNEDNLFMLALILGVIQILFGMVLKVINTSKQFGFKYSLGTVGWMIVVLAVIGTIGLPMINVEIPGFDTSSLPFFIMLGIGGFMMLFLNSPGKNPLVNFGAGLWNAYNNVTGIIGDVLSYIRLFAIGLSGGILASVFNQLALGLSPEIPVVRQLVIILILTVGHGITLFMSTLSAFVHPLRLTFVEFYNNAGFETSQRVFTPLKRVSGETE